MSFFNKLVDVVTDQVGDYVTDKVINSLQPKVKEEVTEHVEEFKKSAVQGIPRTVENKIAEGQDSDSVAKMIISTLLAGKVEPLIQKLLICLQPGIDSIANGLPDTITNAGTGYVREFLDFDANGGESQDREAGSGGFRGLMSKVGDVGNIQERITSFMSTLREKLHPIFESLKPKIWELVPGMVRQALEKLLDNDGEGAQGGQGESRSRGFVGDFLQGQAKDQALEYVPKLVTLVEDPVRALIAKIVDTLEETCNQAFSTKLVASLKEFSVLK